MNALTVGGVYTATLHGLAGNWILAGTATIWQLTGRQVLVQLGDHPDHRRPPAHTAYATGTLETLPDGPRQLVNLLTPQPGPTTITLGWTLQATRNPDDAAHHRDQAAKELANWQPLEPGDGPLDVSALTWLERAVHRAAAGRTAERERDHLIRRLRAGRVDRATLAEATGLDPSRISQISRQHPGRRATMSP